MLITDAAVREAAANLAHSLDGDWELDAEAPADGAAHLIHSDGRGISFRPIFGGTTVQLWITGSVAPSHPGGATPAGQALREAQLTARLPEGHRYNKATTLVTEADEDPELIILRTLEANLLPAFDYKPCYVGHQPWMDLFDSALAQVMDGDPPAMGTPLRDRGAEATTPQPDVGAKAEAATGIEAGSAADSGPADERDPATVSDDEQHPENPDADETQKEGPSATAELDPEVTSPPSGEPGPDLAPQSKPDVEKSSGVADDQPTGETTPTARRRQSSRTPKRRPKASST